MHQLLSRMTFALTVLCLLILSPLPLHAQDSATTATLSGSVRDAAGSVIPSATITLRNPAARFWVQRFARTALHQPRSARTQVLPIRRAATARPRRRTLQPIQSPECSKSQSILWFRRESLFDLWHANAFAAARQI